MENRTGFIGRRATVVYHHAELPFREKTLVISPIVVPRGFPEIFSDRRVAMEIYDT